MLCPSSCAMTAESGIAKLTRPPMYARPEKRSLKGPGMVPR